MNLESPITEVKGIGAKTEKLMNKIGVYTVGDILLHYPRDYVRFKEPLSAGEITQEGIYAVIGKITSAPVLKRTNRMEIVQAKVRDTAGSVELIWFRMPYVRSQLKSQETYIFYGKVKQKGRQFCMEQPQIYTTATVPAENADLAAGICKDRRTQQSDDHKNDPSGIRGNFIKL